MLECIALAGALFVHVAHDPMAGVTTKSTTVWEFVMPLENTVITLHSDPADRSVPIKLYFSNKDYGTIPVELTHIKFPGWNLTDFTASCPVTE